MTPLQMIYLCRRVSVSFGVANAPGDVDINITKKEARRLIKAHDLPADDYDHDVGCVSLFRSDRVAVITFHT